MSPMLHTSTSGSAGTSIQPSRAVDLQPTAVVLGEQRQQAVVGVLADAPVGVVAGRVVEDPEQHGRISRHVLLRTSGRRARARSRCRASPRPATRSSSVSHSRIAGPRSAGSSGNRFGAVQRDAGDDPRVGRRVLGADVEALLAVGLPGRQLAADREPAAPCRARVRHRDRLLGVVGLGEELTCRGVDPAQQIGIDTVPDDAEEPDVAAGLIDLAADRFDVATTIERAAPRRSTGGGPRPVTTASVRPATGA